MFLSNANQLRRTGIPSLTLLAGVLLGVFLYQNYQRISGQVSAEPRQISPGGELTSGERKVVDIFENTAPSVVFITSIRQDWYLYSRSMRETPAGTGSGFIWDEYGHVVTNYHVLAGGDSFEVVLHDQSSYEAKVVGHYRDKDLAVLRIDAPKDKLRPIPLGTNKTLRVGQTVLAIGNPFGLDHSLSTGVVSALDRTLDADANSNRKIEGVIQTDAAINPGNSGGPLLDSSGRLIGVNTQIYSTSGSSAGIGFAIPADTVNQVVPQLIKYGKVIRPGLGFWYHPHNAKVMRYLGVKGILIREVQPGGALERAGLRGIRRARNGRPLLGDIIVGIDGKKITNIDDLANVLDGYKVGDSVEVSYIRDGRTRSAKVQLQEIRTR